MLPDNQPCIDLLSNRGHGLADGILQLLDNKTRMPNSTESDFFKSVHEIHGSSSRHYLQKVPRRPLEEGFVIKHFAGAVVYLAAPASIRERARVRKAQAKRLGKPEPPPPPSESRPVASWMDRNGREPLKEELIAVLLASDEPFVVGVCSGVSLGAAQDDQFAQAASATLGGTDPKLGFAPLPAAFRAGLSSSPLLPPAEAEESKKRLAKQGLDAEGNPKPSPGESVQALKARWTIVEQQEKAQASPLGPPPKRGAPRAPLGTDVTSDQAAAVVAAVAAADAVATVVEAESLRMKMTASKELRTSVDALIVELASSEVRFVRCLKPNHVFQPGQCSSRLLLQQLRYTALMEAVEVMAAAFPVRVSFERIHERLKPHLPPAAQRLDRASFIGKVTEACEVPATCCRLGRSLLFLKGSAAQRVVELAEMADPQAATVELITMLKHVRARRRAGQYISAQASIDLTFP